MISLLHLCLNWAGCKHIAAVGSFDNSRDGVALSPCSLGLGSGLWPAENHWNLHFRNPQSFGLELGGVSLSVIKCRPWIWQCLNKTVYTERVRIVFWPLGLSPASPVAYGRPLWLADWLGHTFNWKSPWTLDSRFNAGVTSGRTRENKCSSGTAPCITRSSYWCQLSILLQRWC